MAAIRNTIQKSVILEAVQTLRNHPTADAVYAEVRKSQPCISKATVYRNLNQLADNGVLNRLHLPDGADCYDHCTHPHYHLRCEQCGCIYDLPFPYTENLFSSEVQKLDDFKVHHHSIIFYGICPHCKS